MKLKIFLFLIFAAFVSFGQNIDSLIQSSKSVLKKLKQGDSIVYYQCHVEPVIQHLVTSSGQTLTAASGSVSITEKFVLKKTEGQYTISHYVSPLTIFPNRKFSGLKMREKKYWEFKFDANHKVNDTGIRWLMVLEKMGKEATEFDYPITKYNKNQIIILSKNNFQQLGIDGDYLISKLLELK